MLENPNGLEPTSTRNLDLGDLLMRAPKEMRNLLLEITGRGVNYVVAVS